ncbi:hypothetical protein F5X68DRAFT_8173 [Plectosphaerella plurivora]|uniref:Uncharacterized protein n=1 Tax=Plectosphaerella plurivora TaxID=936078 RepID=A0A9P8VBG4_9PEZI|nr:hypothetical protein F5X68DRAFT_8173 [Plectosphaerella plurivora]
MNAQDRLPAQPDLSLERLHGDLLTFLPGVSASLLTFVVFGTTKTFRDYMKSRLLPRRLRNVFVSRGTHRLESGPPSPALPPAAPSYDLDAPLSRVGTAESIRLSEIHVERHGRIDDVRDWPMWRNASPNRKQDAVVMSVPRI